MLTVVDVGAAPADADAAALVDTAVTVATIVASTKGKRFIDPP
ncbi:MAG: hypothetical protein ACM3ML_09815 [Micromonosporaceae bacterium]